MKKIALEEHFRHPRLLEYSTDPGAGVSEDMDRRLADFDDLRLEAMDAAGIERSILSHTTPGIEVARDAETATRDAKLVNDFLAEQIARHPDRLGGFAALPTQSPEAPRTNCSA